MADYTPDPALVELIARAVYDADTAQVIGDRQLTWDEQDERCHDWFRAIARAVLVALAAAGRDYAAGRKQAAADIRAQIDANPVPWSPGDVRHAVARITEGDSYG